MTSIRVHKPDCAKLAIRFVGVKGSNTPRCTCGAKKRTQKKFIEPIRVTMTAEEKAATRSGDRGDFLQKLSSNCLLMQQARHRAAARRMQAKLAAARKGKTVVEYRATRAAERAEIAACYARPPVWEPQT